MDRIIFFHIKKQLESKNISIGTFFALLNKV